MRFAQSWQLYNRIPMKSVSVLPDEGFAERLVDLHGRAEGPIESVR